MRAPFGVRIATSPGSFRLSRFLRRLFGAHFRAECCPRKVGVGNVKRSAASLRLGGAARAFQATRQPGRLH